MLDPNQQFKNELNKELRKRRFYSRSDFTLAHTFLWISVLASFGASIMIAAGDDVIHISKVWIAIISGVPGLVVVIEKTFNFSRRSLWDIMYLIDLEELKDEVDFDKTGNLYQVAKKFRVIKRRNESMFAKIGFFKRDGSGTQTEESYGNHGAQTA